jgi:hypothetical protein
MSNKQTKSSNVPVPLPGFKLPSGLPGDVLSQMIIGALSSHLYSGGALRSCGEVRRAAMALSAINVRAKKHGRLDP